MFEQSRKVARQHGSKPSRVAGAAELACLARQNPTKGASAPASKLLIVTEASLACFRTSREYQGVASPVGSHPPLPRSVSLTPVHDTKQAPDWAPPLTCFVSSTASAFQRSFMRFEPFTPFTLFAEPRAGSSGTCLSPVFGFCCT